MSESVSFTVRAIPPSPNKLHGMHWSVRFRLKKSWAEEMRAMIGSKNMAVLRAWTDLNCMIRFEMIIHHAGVFDRDNLYACGKVPLDAATNLEIIGDDGPDFIEFVASQEKSTRKAAHTEFRLSRIA